MSLSSGSPAPGGRNLRTAPHQVKSVLVIGAISNSDREFRLSCEVVLPASYTRIAKSWKAIRAGSRVCQLCDKYCMSVTFSARIAVN